MLKYSTMSLPPLSQPSQQQVAVNYLKIFKRKPFGGNSILQVVTQICLALLGVIHIVRTQEFSNYLTPLPLVRREQ